MYWKKDLAGHFVKYLLVLKKAYFHVLARKAGIRNPNDKASQYKSMKGKIIVSVEKCPTKHNGTV